ncbi:MAG: hypothetical protein ACOYMN_05705 [Roseimicrobium sp.]
MTYTNPRYEDRGAYLDIDGVAHNVATKLSLLRHRLCTAPGPFKAQLYTAPNPYLEGRLLCADVTLVEYAARYEHWGLAGMPDDAALSGTAPLLYGEAAVAALDAHLAYFEQSGLYGKDSPS